MRSRDDYLIRRRSDADVGDHYVLVRPVFGYVYPQPDGSWSFGVPPHRAATLEEACALIVRYKTWFDEFRMWRQARDVADREAEQ